jgi:signal peptidase I
MDPEHRAPEQDSGRDEATTPHHLAPQPPKRKRQGLRDVLSILAVLASAVVLALILINFVFQSYQVDGPSMQNTLHNGDHLIVWKVPRTLARIDGGQYVPNRGDIIVFKEPGLANFGDYDSKQLIKRVIGLPGDHIVIKNNIVTIYNKQHPNGFVPKETLPFGKHIPKTSGHVNLTLKPHQIFVMGDNRPNSLDSRVFGPVNTKHIIGKLALRILPINQAKIF